MAIKATTDNIRGDTTLLHNLISILGSKSP
jgi:hypothetical protein